MKRLIVVAAIAVLCITLGGCFPPTIPIDDPDDPPITPVLTIPVAAFSFYPPEYPVQTGSRILFDGSASYDPDGEIMWGQWDFDYDDDSLVDGRWVNMVKEIENGEEVWVAYPVMMEEFYTYPAVGDYTVMLTVWDYDGNQSSTTRIVEVE